MACGHCCLTLFHITSSGVVHPLRMMVSNLPSGGELYRGLTPKEAELVSSLVVQLSEVAETLRKLGWRLIKSSSHE